MFFANKWKGQNLPGKILMWMREDIRHQNKAAQMHQNAEKVFTGASEEAGFYIEKESVMKRRKNSNGSF